MTPEPEHEQYRRRKAEQEARYKYPFFERRFGWWRNPSDRFAALIAVFTAGLFAATFGLWDATKDLVRDAQSSGRAWIVPHLIHLEAPLKAGEAANLLLYFGNSGKEPAIRVGQHNESASLPPETILGETTKTVTNRLRTAIENMEMPDSCEIASRDRFTGVVYPGSIDGQSNAISVEPKWITEAVADGRGFIVVKGCIIYETIKETHKSKYCFFYNGLIANMRPAEHRTYLQSCPGIKDNEAD